MNHHSEGLRSPSHGLLRSVWMRDLKTGEARVWEGACSRQEFEHGVTASSAQGFAV